MLQLSYPINYFDTVIVFLVSMQTLLKVSIYQSVVTFLYSRLSYQCFTLSHKLEVQSLSKPLAFFDSCLGTSIDSYKKRFCCVNKSQMHRN